MPHFLFQLLGTSATSSYKRIRTDFSFLYLPFFYPSNLTEFSSISSHAHVCLGNPFSLFVAQTVTFTFDFIFRCKNECGLFPESPSSSPKASHALKRPKLVFKLFKVIRLSSLIGSHMAECKTYFYRQSMRFFAIQGHPILFFLLLFVCAHRPRLMNKQTAVNLSDSDTNSCMFLLLFHSSFGFGGGACVNE